MNGKAVLIATLVAAGGLAVAQELQPVKGADGADQGRRRERGPGEFAARMKERFADMDADKNGKVTIEEYKTYTEKHMEEQFKRLDRNGDGVLSADDRMGEGPGGERKGGEGGAKRDQGEKPAASADARL